GTERLFNKIGVLYFETGDYRKSIQYFRKALSQVQNQLHPNPYFIVNYKNNIASALRKLQDNEEALKIYKSLLSYEINKNELLHNIGATYLNEGKPKEAITFLLKVQYNTRIKLNDIGHAYLLLGKTDSAHYFLQKAMVALPLLKKEIKDLDYGITLRWLGDLSLKEGRFSEALSFFQQSIIQIDYDFNDTLVTHNPTSFQGLHNSYLLFNVLAAKGFAFNQLFKSNHSYEMLKSALAAYLSSINLARHVEKTFNSDEARLFFSNQAVEAYRNAIDISLQLYEFSQERNYLDQAFSLMENSKASVLLAGIQQLSLESIVGLPQDLIREERNYKMAITKLNLELGNLTTQQEISEAQKKLTDLEIKLSE
ncbi:MAG TPA: tetratricopeptide repeat protein, partial [Puia sp.]|nr:tetratricopeptide repeat protein [Puia sp.]